MRHRFVQQVTLVFLYSFFLYSFLASGQLTPLAGHDPDAGARAREKWFRRGRMAATGQPAAELRHHAWIQAIRTKRSDHKSLNLPALEDGGLTGEWRPVGPAPLASDASGYGFRDYNWISGRATAVAIDTSDPTGNTVYVGGAYAGLWKSVNAASPLPSNVVWVPLLDDQPTLAVGAIAIQPGQPQTLLVGTGETNSSLDSYYGLGILRSTNGGTSWTLIRSSLEGHPFAGMGFSKIAFSTDNAMIAVAAAGFASQGEASGLERGSHRGIYYSNDAGVTWQTATIKDGTATITASSITSVVYDSTARKFLAAIRRHGFYSSTDGMNWTRLSSQPGAGLSVTNCPADARANSFACPIYRGEIAVVSGRDEVYVWFMDLPGNDPPTTDRGIWRSVNGGPWTQISSQGLTNCGDLLGCGVEQGDYSLSIAALANGTPATDLYVGAVNLFKCTLLDGSNAVSCSGGAWRNLTHAYGCSEVARVHPNQHEMKFLIASGKALGYFANDGGIYRTLDGFLGLTRGLNGACEGSNQFESLNETLGSMAQFVSISQHPTDGNTLLGGTHNNGTVATNQAFASSAFINIFAGDGGHAAIDPVSPTRWFASTPDIPPAGLEIDRCDLETDCRTGQFSAVVTSGDLGGDDGEFYFPYILDPQDHNQLLIGTCRLWRAAVAGGTFTPLSANLDSGSGSCTGNEVNQIRAIAAGGPKGSHGFSNVAFVTTAGDGPLAKGENPIGGRVFVSTNADSDAPLFADVTGSVYPGQFPISAVAIDSSDSTGRTAYVTVMGFGVSHVFKTVNAGTTWSGFGSISNGFPDVPANSVLIDGEAGKAYVGTDIGVFVSSTSTPSWDRVGTDVGSGRLPTVPVVALELFHPNAGTKILRAATYGRGIWEHSLVTTPDFRVTLSPSTKTVFAGEQATFAGTLTALNGYASSVTVTCTGTNKPATCVPSPTIGTPTKGGVPFHVNTSGAPGAYSFSIHATGSDGENTTRDAAATLEIVDFGLGPPSPASLSATQGSVSGPATILISAQGPFDGTVALTCPLGLPAGATCRFSPSSSVSPIAGAPVAVTLTIATASNTPAGTYNIRIEANSAGAPAAKSVSLVLTVSDAPDYTLTFQNSTLSAPVGEESQFSGTLTSLRGYNTSVDIGCGPGAPSTCVGGRFTPTVAGTPFHVTARSNEVGIYEFEIVGTGTDARGTKHQQNVRFEVTAEFSLRNASGTQTVTAGGTASYSLDMVPGGAIFSSNVTFTCSPSSLPALAHCGFSPASVPAGSGPTTVTLRVSTTAPIAELRFEDSLPVYAACISMTCIVLAAPRKRVRVRRKSAAFMWVALILCCVILGCGGGDPGGGSGHPGTPPGSYAVRVAAACGSQTQEITVNLNIQ